MSHRVHVLLIEDDDVDAEAILRAFAHFEIPNPVTLVRNGYEALDVLRGENGAQKLPSPYVILLDLNMPRMNGLEFLTKLRQDPMLAKSVVFVLTTSNHHDDIVAAYDSHVAGYMLKTRLDNQFTDLMLMMKHYWQIVELPVFA